MPRAFTTLTLLAAVACRAVPSDPAGSVPDPVEQADPPAEEVSIFARSDPPSAPVLFREPDPAPRSATSRVGTGAAAPAAARLAPVETPSSLTGKLRRTRLPALVLFTTPEGARGTPRTTVLDVSDLVRPIASYAGPEIDVPPSGGLLNREPVDPEGWDRDRNSITIRNGKPIITHD